jgi:hypothetical protein
MASTPSPKGKGEGIVQTTNLFRAVKAVDGKHNLEAQVRVLAPQQVTRKPPLGGFLVCMFDGAEKRLRASRQDSKAGAMSRACRGTARPGRKFLASEASLET